jgi:hypothetical protein
MHRITATAIAIVATAATANAQFLPQRPATPFGSPLSGGIGAPAAPPGFNPYLNLLRGGNSAAVNYYGLVRPQQAVQAQLQAIQALQQQGTPSTSEPDDPTMPGLVVGTRVRFLNTSGYFLNLGGVPAGTTTGGFSTPTGGRGSTTGQSGPVQGLSSSFGTLLGGFGTSPAGRGGASVPRPR